MRKKQGKNHNRVILLYLFVLLISFVVIAKIVKVQQFDMLINTSSQPKFFTVEAPRGNVLADDGSLLAVSMPLYNIFLDMSVINEKIFETNVKSLAKGLAILFKDKTDSEYERFLRNSRNSKKNRYVKLKLKVTHHELISLKRLPILKLDQNKGGLIAEIRPHRETPFGELARRTVGENREVNPVGIERAYNHFLSGIDGVHLKRKIANGVWINQDSKKNEIPKPGNDVLTTINIDMQDVAEKALERTLIKENADWGCVVLMEVETGKVKVIANLKKDTLNRVSEYYNYAMAEHVAPGSTFKLASIIAGLEDGKFKISDSVDLQKGRVEYYDRVMIDSPHDYNKVTIKKAFVISSNVGISKIINNSYKEDPTEFTDRIYKMGLSTPLDLELLYPNYLQIPIPNHLNWSGVTLPWMSIGYEMSLTALHILTFYNAIANKGKMMKPIFTTSILSDGKAIVNNLPEVINPSICSQSTIDKVIPLLTEVTEIGTARNIKSKKYKIAGKTGTTVLNYANRKEDEAKIYQASFAGFFPAENPKYSCIVVINNPKKGEVYGGKVAAPIFKELSDKVFALDMNIHKPIVTLNNMKDFPTIKNGNSEAVYLMLNQLNIQSNYIQANYVNTTALSDKVEIFANNIEDDLKKGKMPDLKGMNLKDVSFLLEKYGLIVKVSGAGEVLDQSIKKGKDFVKGSVIKLLLI
tara:strand:+ start:3905 stop:5992 length:2088 start_codon:yes stop_codon:yes gene_type:complete